MALRPLDCIDDIVQSPVRCDEQHWDTVSRAHECSTEVIEADIFADIDCDGFKQVIETIVRTRTLLRFPFVSAVIHQEPWVQLDDRAILAHEFAQQVTAIIEQEGKHIIV